MVDVKIQRIKKVLCSLDSSSIRGIGIPEPRGGFSLIWEEFSCLPSFIPSTRSFSISTELKEVGKDFENCKPECLRGG